MSSWFLQEIGNYDTPARSETELETGRESHQRSAFADRRPGTSFWLQQGRERYFTHDETKAAVWRLHRSVTMRLVPMQLDSSQGGRFGDELSQLL
jgi:hypothetical protein